MSSPTPPESIAPDDSLERRALRNTRALVDLLESDEAARRRRQKRALVVIAAGAVIAGIALFHFGMGFPVLSAEERLRADCEVTAMAAVSGERIERLRAEYPGLPFQEISKKLQSEGPATQAEARRRCESLPPKKE